MRLTITLVFLLTLFGLNAAEQKILDVKTTGMGRTKELKSSLIVKSKRSTAEAIALVLKSSKKSEKDEKYSVSALKRGVVLKEKDGLEVISISSNDFAADRGGHFNVRYLKNGINKTYDQQELQIQLERDKWTVYHQGREVSMLDFKVKKLLGKPIGIAKINIMTK